MVIRILIVFFVMSGSVHLEDLFSRVRRKPREGFLKYVKRGHGLLCPHLHFCKGKVYNKRKHGMFLASDNCSYSCKGCTCDDDCEKYEDCCPDKKRRGAFFKVSSLRTACISPMLKDTLRHDVGYPWRVIQGCPKSSNNSEIRRKCESGQYMDYYHNFDARTPVTDTHFQTYANKYCAMCNGVYEYRTWNVSAMCETMLQLPSYNSYKEIIEMMWKKRECNFKLTVTPDIQRNTRTCYVADSHLISSCNVTGLWDTYDADIERACKSYTVIFNEKYRNPFCYLCNSKTPYFYTCQPAVRAFENKFPVFSSILNFQLWDDDRLVRDGGECDVGYTHDYITNKCREIYCINGKWLQDERCKTILQPKVGSIYVLNLTYTVNVNTNTTGCEKTTSVNNLNQKIARRLKIVLRRELSNIGGVSVEVEVRGMAQMRSVACPSEQNVTWYTMKDGNPTLKALFLRLEVYTPNYNATLNFDVLEEALYNLTSESQFFLLSSNVSVDLVPDTQWLTYFDSPQLSNLGKRKRVVRQKQTSFNDYEILNLIRSVHDDFYEPAAIYIHRTRLCPHFILSDTEFTIEDNGQSLHIPSLDVSIHHNDFIVLGKTSRICIDSFHSKTREVLLEKHMTLSTEGIIGAVLACLSIICLLIAISIYLLLPALRTLPGLNNMALAITLMVSQAMFQFGAGHTNLGDVCKIIGLVIHYTWLSTLLWMNVCSLHMFRVFTNSRTTKIGSRKDFLFYFLYAQSIPVIFVLINILVSKNHSGDIGYGSPALCFISTKNMLGYTFALPVGLIILCNMMLFGVVVICIYKSAKSSELASTDRQYLHVYFRLSTLTGMTWIFGFVYQWTGNIVYSYLFIVFNASQGIFLLISFVCTRRVIRMIRTKSGCSPRPPQSTITRREAYSLSVTTPYKIN